MTRPLIVVGVLAALVIHHVGVGRPGSAGPDLNGPALVTASRLNVAPDGSTSEVTLHVTAGPQDLGLLSVFWIVSLPSTPRPWEDPRYLAPAKTVGPLAAGTSVDLTWSGEPIPLPLGRYEVTAWVHRVVGADTTQHVAGNPVGSFWITQPAPSSVHLGPGWLADQAIGPLVLQAISITLESPESQSLVVEATVENAGPQPVDGSAFWSIGRLTDSQPALGMLWQSEAQVLPALEPGESRTVSWTRSIGLPPATYGLSMWVHTETARGSQHSHGSRSIPVTLAPDVRHVARHGPPGTVHVVSANRDPAGSVRAVLANDQAADVDLWLSMDSVRDDRRYDWFKPIGQPPNGLVATTIAALAERTIELPLPIPCTPDQSLAWLRLLSKPEPGRDTLIDDVLVDACP